jgi:putative hydrolase of the HAD superfamily
VKGLLLLDLDDTLIDRKTAYRRWATGFLHMRGRYSDEMLAAMLEADGPGLQLQEVMLQRVLDRVPLQESLDELVQIYDREFPPCFDPPTPEVVDALAEARAAGWRLGLCTNGARLQELKITRTGIDEHVDGWYTTRLNGTWKPDVGAFTGAMEMFEGAPENTWMIGDGASTDIKGAEAAGLPNVWISWGRLWTHREFRPTLISPDGASAIRQVLAIT